MAAASLDELIKTLKDRFSKNMRRHTGIDWSSVQAKLEASPEKLQALHEMERTGGEPDVIGYDEKTGEFIFCDCSLESPAGRRSICYDREALDSRKENKPSGSAVETATSMGIELLTEQQYRELQEVGEFDRKTSSWVKRRQRYVILGARFSAIGAMTMFSRTTTALTHTMPPGVFVVGLRFSFRDLKMAHTLECK